MVSSVMLVATFVAGAVASLASAASQAEGGAYEFTRAEHNMTTYDGLHLYAQSYSSVPTTGGEKFPLVIFPNSWAVSVTYEYNRAQETLAKAGYIAFAYQTRGWYHSQGLIDMAGERDLADARTVVDYCVKNIPNVDKNNIAFVGISYGAGIGMLAAANISEVSAVVAMSGWMSMFDSLIWQWSPSKTWGTILDSLADIFGHPRSDLKKLLHNILTFTDVDDTLKWASQRAVTADRQAALEKRQVPVFVVNNMEDNLFHSNNELQWWRNYKGPKKIMLSQGTHAEAEAPFLVSPLLSTIYNQLWVDTFDFLDYHLKKIDNGVMEKGVVKMQLQSGLLDRYIAWDKPQWPPADGYSELVYTLGERKQGQKFGQLVSKTNSREQPPTGAYPLVSSTIRWTSNTKMTCGTPVVTAAIEPFSPFRLNLNKPKEEYELVLRSEPLDKEQRVCGSIRIEDLTVASSTDRFQVYAYAYAEPPNNNNAVLLGHTARTEWQNATAGTPFTLLPMDFRVSCFTVKKGHRLALGFNMHNALYGPASATEESSLTFLYDNKATVTFPVVVG